MLPQSDNWPHGTGHFAHGLDKQSNAHDIHSKWSTR